MFNKRDDKCRKNIFQTAAFEAVKDKPRGMLIEFSCPICKGAAQAIMTYGRLYAECTMCKMAID